jgi:hypothetical protein
MKRMSGGAWRNTLSVFCAFALCSCGVYFNGPIQPFGPGDYAIRLAQPYSAEVDLARKRLRNFVHRANTNQIALLTRQPIVAVQASDLRSAEIPWLSHQLASGQVVRGVRYYAQPRNDVTNVPVKFLLLFDSRTGKLAEREGVLVIDTPARGTVARFGGTYAVYAGTGWW